jgi:hypothetical protein
MKTNLTKLISAAAGMALLVSGIALPTAAALAQTSATAGLGAGVAVSSSATVGGTGTGAGANGSAGASTKASLKAAALAKLITTATTRADAEITRRINALNALSTRVNAMAKVSASDKASLSSTITTQIAAMNTLEAQIAVDAAANSTTSLKADIQSITKSYRIFALVIPQGAIEAASDRVLDISGMFTTLSGELQARITDAQNAGANMSTSVAALADMNTQITNVQIQANAAVSETASLQPDNGDATIMASNTAALQDARTKIKAAQADLTAARADAGTIVKALLAVKVSAAASSTTSVSGSATTTP